jgi:carbamoyltransferase
MRILGVNATFHDPGAALVVDGRVVAAAEEERFTRRKHGHADTPFAAWEMPAASAAWCLSAGKVVAGDLDAVGFSYDPALVRPAAEMGLDDPFDGLRTRYAVEAPSLLADALPGLDPGIVRHVAHHVAHAASAGLAAPHGDGAVLVLDGRGERVSHLAGRYVDGELEVLASQPLPHSLGLLYEEVTEHLGFCRGSDEFKVMALASYGEPRQLPELREAIRTTGDGGFVVEPQDWSRFAKRRAGGEDVDAGQADLAASVQRRLEEVLVELACWTYDATGARSLGLAGGVALNCVANSRIATDGPFERVWVQPAAGDAGTALGAALHLARSAGEPGSVFAGVDLGRSFCDADIERTLREAKLPYTRPADLAAEVADALAADAIVGWFEGASEWGPRALGHRSLLAHPGRRHNLDRLNAVKGRESFRPVAPAVLADRAVELLTGPLPSPYMLFTHQVRAGWQERIAAGVHVDGTARAQTVEPADEPLLAALLAEFDQRTGLPALINTSSNTAGRPIVDSPRDALEVFGSAPVDLLAIGPFVLRRGSLA